MAKSIIGSNKSGQIDRKSVMGLGKTSVSSDFSFDVSGAGVDTVVAGFSFDVSGAGVDTVVAGFSFDVSGAGVDTVVAGLHANDFNLDNSVIGLTKSSADYTVIYDAGSAAVQFAVVPLELVGVNLVVGTVG